MPDDATEGVTTHSSGLQPSINLHAPVTAYSPIPIIPKDIACFKARQKDYELAQYYVK